MSESIAANERPNRVYLSISWKLLIATALVGSVAVVIAIIGLEKIYVLNRNLTQTVDFLATNTKLASLLKGDLVSATRAERSMMLSQSEDGTRRFSEVVDEVTLTMRERIEQLRSVVIEYDRQALAVFAEKWKKWEENHAEVRRFTAKNSDMEAREISIGDARIALERMQVAVEQFENQTRAETAKLSEADFNKLLLASQVSRAALAVQRTEKDLILAHTPEEVRRYEELFEPLLEELAARIDALEATALDDDREVLNALEKAHQDYLNANSRIRFAAGEKTNFIAYNLVYETGAPLAYECEVLLDGLIARNEKRMLEYRQTSQEIYTSARNTLLSISLVGIVTSISLSYFMGYQIARRLQILSRYAQRIQLTDDLSLPTPELGHDEVGMLAMSFENMRRSLHFETNRLSEQTDYLADVSRSLDAKNREMEQFIYTVSHDLKSPLVSCKGLVGLLKEDIAEEDDEAVLDSAERLDQAIDNLDQIIEDLLMLSRIGRKELNYSEVDVYDLLDQLVDDLEDRIEDTDAIVEIQEDIPSVIADESDVRRLFENLVTNALKYAYNDEQPRITIGGSVESDEVRFFVHDNGPGIDPQYHQRIFRLFQRLDTSQLGTGVGLASVEKTMTMHNGRVWIESELGKGACFWLAFPRRPRLR